MAHCPSCGNTLHSKRVVIKKLYGTGEGEYEYCSICGWNNKSSIGL